MKVASNTRQRFSYDLGSIGDRFDKQVQIVDFIRTTSRTVLDVGCHDGFVSRRLTSLGIRVTGLDVDADAAIIASGVCERVVVADLNSPLWTNSVGSTFDALLFGDVLEHLIDPESVLRSSLRLLNPGGYVVISLPNVVHWTIRIQVLLGRFNYSDHGILDRTHLHFFTPDSALNLIRSAGLEVIRQTPVIGGFGAGHIRPLWKAMADVFPGLFSFQTLFYCRTANP